MTETMPNPAGLRTPRPQRPWLRAPLALGYALAFALFAWWLDRRMLGVARDTYFGWFVLGNALPGLVLAGLLTAATRRPGVSFLVVAALQWLVYHACAIKLDILDDPIGLQDLYFVTSLNQASIAVLGRYIEHPALLAAGVLAVAALVVVLWRIEKPAFRAFRATQEGRSMPLPLIERRVKPALPGADYLGPEFRGSTYRLKFMQNGRVIWVDVDAQTGRIVGKSGD